MQLNVPDKAIMQIERETAQDHSNPTHILSVIVLIGYLVFGHYNKHLMMSLTNPPIHKQHHKIVTIIIAHYSLNVFRLICAIVALVSVFLFSQPLTYQSELS